MVRDPPDRADSLVRYRVQTKGDYHRTCDNENRQHCNLEAANEVGSEGSSS